VGYYLHYNPTKSHYECLLCRNAIHKCLACSDENTCTKCELPNLLGSTAKCDLCSPGFLNYDGYCMLEAGCMSVKEINFSEQICLSCRDYLNFVYEASSHQCICEKGFEMSMVMIEAEKKCISVCGDGILISNEEECDDGNLDSYDGCSNHCKVEEYFDCSKTSPSKCVLYKDV
jgi:cysteine-rich repeat protein